jgi:hypothetical protein
MSKKYAECVAVIVFIVHHVQWRLHFFVFLVSGVFNHQLFFSCIMDPQLSRAISALRKRAFELASSLSVRSNALQAAIARACFVMDFAGVVFGTQPASSTDVNPPKTLAEILGRTQAVHDALSQVDPCPTFSTLQEQCLVSVATSLALLCNFTNVRFQPTDTTLAKLASECMKACGQTSFDTDVTCIRSHSTEIFYVGNRKALAATAVRLAEINCLTVALRMHVWATARLLRQAHTQVGIDLLCCLNLAHNITVWPDPSVACNVDVAYSAAAGIMASVTEPEVSSVPRLIMLCQVTLFQYFARRIAKLSTALRGAQRKESVVMKNLVDQAIMVLHAPVLSLLERTLGCTFVFSGLNGDIKVGPCQSCSACLLFSGCQQT